MKNHPIPSFGDLEVFLVVCKTAGFRAAARQLGLSPSHVSDTIARLEAQLELPLFTRNTRSVMPTEAARALAERMAPLLEATQAVLADVTSGARDVGGFLKLNVSGAVMVDILTPLLVGFRQQYPAVRVELLVDDRLVDFIAQGCVAGIRYGEHLAQDMISVPIGPARQQVALCAAPSYLHARGVPTHPRDLLLHDCIRMRFSSGALSAWRFECGSQHLTLDPISPLVLGVNAAAAAIDLARAGQGFIYMFRNWLQPAIDSGELVAVLPEWWEAFDGPRLYFSSRSMPAALRAFIDFVALHQTH